jgi:hypothetical protein
MAEEKSSGFFFDVRKWRGSRDVQRMSYAERGVYFDMMLEQWEKRNLLDSCDVVAQQLALTAAHEAEIRAAWPVVRSKFVLSKGDDRRIYNPQLEQTRRKQLANARERSKSGRLGGLAKAANRKKEADLRATKATAMPSKAVAKHSDLTRQDVTRQDQRSLSSALFDRFWLVYPKKVAKDAARKAFTKRNPDAVLVDRMVAAVQQQAQSEQWQRDAGRFIPNPSTWLNQARWQDEPTSSVSRARQWTFDCPHEPHCSTAGQCVVKRRGEAV